MSKVTWLLEKRINFGSLQFPSHGFEVLEYCGTLTQAKNLAERNYTPGAPVSVLKIVGDRFGEGYHDYRLALKHGRWVKVDTRTGEPLVKN